MKCIMEMFTARQRAAIYYPIARSWGWCREKLALEYTPDGVLGIGISRLWMVDDPIFQGCAEAHDRYYATLGHGDSTLEGDLQLRDCMDLQVLRVESGEIQDPWADND